MNNLRELARPPPALKGKTATGFHSIKDDMVNAGATFVEREVVVDGNVITSRKPDDLPAFVAAIIEQMRRGETRNQLRLLGKLIRIDEEPA